MKATELRIGNIVRQAFATITVKGIYASGILATDFNRESHCTYGNIEGELLTNEWLEKFGFTNGEGMKFSENEYFSIAKQDEYPDTTLFFENENTAVSVKYVHELQNLYHAITGEELTLNPSPST